ncbi:MAG: 2-dehydropantoate 2-reductase [Anaeromyxobacter sp.]
MSNPDLRNLRYAVVGLGALGGYYGGLLARAGCEVHFLARSNYAAVAQHGLFVESPNGNFQLSEVRVYDDPQHMPSCDVVFVTLKATQNDALRAILPRLLTDGGTTVLVQNGLGEEERLPECAQHGAIYAGLGFICATQLAPHRILHQDYGTLRLAAYRESDAALKRHSGLLGLARWLEACGLLVEIDPHFLSARWRKLVWNIPFNGLSVALEANTEELLSDPLLRELIHGLMLEVISAGRAEGARLDDGCATDMIEATLRMRPYFPSMFHDFAKCSRLELDAMYWTPIERARTVGCPMIRVEMLARQLAFLSERKQREAIGRG